MWNFNFNRFKEYLLDYNERMVHDFKTKHRTLSKGVITNSPQYSKAVDGNVQPLWPNG